MLRPSNIPANSSFKWYLNNGITPIAESSSITVSVAGSYKLIRITNGYIQNYPILNVISGSTVIADFAVENLPDCSSAPVNFKNLSKGDGLTYSWSFGDPLTKKLNRSTESNPIHQYVGSTGNGTQTFTVSLTVTNKNGCSNSISKNISLKQSPGTEMDGTGAGIYAEKDYFIQCTNVPTTFTFFNKSSTSSTNVGYSIFWGDGTGRVNLDKFTSITHRYRVGLYVLFYTATGKNGCSITKKYRVFVGTSPKASFANPDALNTCIGNPLVFKTPGLKGNTPGTIYTVTYSDKTIVNYAMPPDTLMHTFLTNSVDKTALINSVKFNNSYYLTIEASNPCGSATAFSGPVYVSDSPRSSISASSYAVCLNNTVRLKSKGVDTYSVSANGYQVNKLIWQITPGKGYEVNSDNLGNDQLNTDVKSWLGGAKELDIKFVDAGSYNIKLISGSDLCGVDSSSVQICVNPTPEALFDVDVSVACSPGTITTSNRSIKPLCGDNSYKWSISYIPSECSSPGISYTLLNGTTLNSATPVFNFAKSGTYIISLVNTFPVQGCSSLVFSRNIIINEKPIAVLYVPDKLFVNQAFKPKANIQNCQATSQLTYQWLFAGSAFFTSTSAEPDSVKYAKEGKYLISLTVSNDCGFTEIVKEVKVTRKPTFSIPSTFTPNGDGINDTWAISGLEITDKLSIKVFNRNGNIVFENRGYYNPWNGQFNGYRLSAGVYYYIIENNNAQQPFTGWVSIFY